LRKIKLEKWKSNAPVYDKLGNMIPGKTEEKEEDLLVALNVLILNKKPEDIPKGLDHFRTYGRLSKAFDKANKSRVLELEETDYTFLKDMIEKDTPGAWGMNQDILKAVEAFMETKSEGQE